MVRGNTCASCNSKRAILSKLFGGWPIKLYSDLPKEIQDLFWADSPSSKAGLESALKKHIVHDKVKQSTKGSKGKFYPISVYHTMGYRGVALDNIAKTCDKVYDESLKEYTYCLDVKERSEGEIDKEVQSELLNLMNSSCKKTFASYVSPKKRARSSSGGSDDSKTSKKSSRHSTVTSTTCRFRAAKAAAVAKEAEKQAKVLAKEEAKKAQQEAKAKAKAAAKKQKADAADAKKRCMAAQKEKVKEEKEDYTSRDHMCTAHQRLEPPAH
jgi:hypothetical protein